MNKHFPPVPSWLDPSKEVSAIDPPWDKHKFQVVCIDTLLLLGCDIHQAIGVTAHLMLESGRGQSFRAYNLGGVKLWKSTAENYKKTTGQSISWWRDWGHLEQGDPEVCYYRAYDSFSEFLEQWLKSYVPKLNSEPLVRETNKKRGLVKGQPLLEPEKSADYRLAGAHFHRLNGREFGRWFEWMIKAGYRGAKTKKLWQVAVNEQRELETEAKTHWAQARLGVIPDGLFGPKSKAACAKYQQNNGLDISETITLKTLELLVIKPVQPANSPA